MGACEVFSTVRIPLVAEKERQKLVRCFGTHRNVRCIAFGRKRECKRLAHMRSRRGLTLQFGSVDPVVTTNK